MNRNEFLQQKWRTYPTTPKDSLFVGRVHEIHAKSGHWRVILVRETQSFERTFPRLLLSEDSLVDVLQILIPGDLITISEKGVVTLLAPQLAKMPKRIL